MTILDKFRLDGRIAIVTDGASVLGGALARGLAEAGADLVLPARHTDEVERTSDLLAGMGRRVMVVEADVTNPADCTTVVEAAEREFGKVDVLVNNAEIAAAGKAIDTTVLDFRSVIDNNLHGSYWAAQACARVMLPGSSIINISSISGLTTTGIPQAAYSASKAAIMGLTRDLAQQWGIRKGIRVNSIAQGFIDGANNAGGCPAEGHLERTLLGRTGGPEEIAGTLVWLASEAGGYVTGQTVVVDGGVTIT
ncbi:SDR family NAD(P)-dependent oxidoreductase [Rhodococcus sp. P1Y]|uniref:SDR family NAD(P)-dependent oxidoreductase n=1 Tax=Rhodococcus sp. P1Y TaxID=1302308 RepID=UPI000EAEB2A4|nr:SDR family oxidoreductase [Rhodococcus sp. P1Y]AYJ48829.1 SDR family oxidoreductase [Rhodococcus sp. P1Y]